MNIIIRPNGTLSIYEQICNQMKNAIVTGELSPGEALMSIRALAAKLGVSVITTKKAYEMLEQEKLIRSVPGKGFYVCEYNSDYLKEKQYIDLEKRLAELLEDCEKAGMKKEEIMDLVDTLLG
jgi:GntR family transcriptional regulator